MSLNTFISTQNNKWQNSSSNTWIGASASDIPTISIYSINIQRYLSTSVIQKSNKQNYSNLSAPISWLDQTYIIIPGVYSISKQVYADVVVVSSTYKLLYTEIPIVITDNIQTYTECSMLYNSVVFKYAICYDIKSASKRTYSIANEPIYSSTAQIYNVANLPIYTRSVQRYQIPLQTSFISKYRINTPISTKFSAKYDILNYQPVSKSFIGSYTFSQSGLLGISERYAGCYKPWQQYTTDRTTHLHLFNTFTDERKGAYERYYTLNTSITCMAQRVITGDNRTCFYEVYEQKSSERNLRYSSYDVFTSDRTIHFARFGIFSSEVTGFMAAVLNNVSTERTGFLRPIYNTYRHCYAKSWHVSEIWCVTHAKEKDRLGTQRYALCETEQRTHASIRNMMFDVCCISYPITINPEYNTLAFKIGYADGFTGGGSGTINDSVGSNYPGPILFENRTVVPQDNSLYTLPINFDLYRIDMLLLDAGSQTPVYCAKHSLIDRKFTKVSTHTYRYTGYIIPMQQTMLVKVSYFFSNKGSLTDYEYFAELSKHGYLKVVINGETMAMDESLVIDVPATSLVPFSIDILDTELLQDSMSLKLMWAYPYTEIKTNYITIYGTV